MKLEVSIESVTSPIHIPGWVDGRILEDVQELCREAKCVVNVGVWKGRSVCAIADVLPEGGFVYAVDHWLGSPSERETNHKQAANNPLSVYQEFLIYAHKLEMLDRIVPLTMYSYDASRWFSLNSIDLVFIDGGHDFGSVWSDLTHWYPRLKYGGVICGDDYNWDGVNEAVDRYAQSLGVEVEKGVDGKYWKFGK